MSSILNRTVIRTCKILNTKKYAYNEILRASICNSNSLRFIFKNVSKKKVKPNLFAPDYGYNRDTKTEEEGSPLYNYSLLLIPIATFILGTWQIQRRKEKLELIADLEQRYARDPIELPQDLTDIESLEYYAIKVKGTFLYDKEFLIGPRSLILDGEAASEKRMSSREATGYYVITPFKLEDRDLTILVNRGWIPRRMKDPSKRKPSKIEGVTEIVGRVRSNERRPPFIQKNYPENGIWNYRDVYAMAELVGCDPVFLDMTTKNPPGGPVSGQTRISIRNEHLSYIFTWYTLSGITGYMWYRLFVQLKPLW